MPATAHRDELLRKRVDLFARMLPGIEQGDVRALHRGRVATRRLRELLPVLELLYDNDGSVQDVAEKLHLHRSSIYNRLGRIRQLLGVDPLKGMVRLELHAALKARRWAARPRI